MNNSCQNTFGSDDSADSDEQTLSAGEDLDSETVDDLQQNGDLQRHSDLQQQGPDDSAPPEFGLLDVIEAFTAMRHECRTQTRENRELSAAIQGATENLLRLEAQWPTSTVLDEQKPDQDGLRKFVEAIVEIDIHLSRAVEATIKSTRAQLLADLLAKSIQADFESRGIISRWFCRPFFKSVLRIIESNQETNVDSSTNEGLTMVVARVRRIMSDRGIQRTETIGQVFDAATMHAIASVESDQQPSGYVDEQISPTYFWRGKLFRCADVRVAR